MLLTRLFRYRHKQSIKETTAKIGEMKTKGLDVSSLQASLKKLEEEEAQLRKQEEEFSHKEKVCFYHRSQYNAIAIFNVFFLIR
jgi:uncharacterized protein (DUF1919 family)